MLYRETGQNFINCDPILISKENNIKKIFSAEFLCLRSDTQ